MLICAQYLPALSDLRLDLVSVVPCVRLGQLGHLRKLALKRDVCDDAARILTALNTDHVRLQSLTSAEEVAINESVIDAMGHLKSVAELDIDSFADNCLVLLMQKLEHLECVHLRGIRRQNVAEALDGIRQVLEIGDKTDESNTGDCPRLREWKYQRRHRHYGKD